MTTNLPSLEHIWETFPRVEEITMKLGVRCSPKWRSSGDTTGKAITICDEGTDISAEVHNDEVIVQRAAKNLEEHEPGDRKRKLVETGGR